MGEAVKVQYEGAAMNWYQLKQQAVFEKLDASESGLSDAEAEKRLHHYGPNRLAEEEKISRILILLHQFASPLIYVLIIAGIVTFHLKDKLTLRISRRS